VTTLALAALGHAAVMTEFAQMTWADVQAIPANVWRLLSDLFPPSLKPAVLTKVGWGMLETAQMSLVGTVLGATISLPLGVLAARGLTPHWTLYALSRGIVSFARTVPDLVWAIFFVTVVGLGPIAGMLTLLVDTVGFAGRFFGESMEEVDPHPREAITALGGTRLAGIVCTVLPAAGPSMVNTFLFSFERAVQSSVVLGLVGAGGIGMLLEEPMTWARYEEAATVVLGVFAMLVVVEQVSARLRRRFLGHGAGIRM
jgi:phosphonate transport system permease protein